MKQPSNKPHTPPVVRPSGPFGSPPGANCYQLFRALAEFCCSEIKDNDRPETEPLISSTTPPTGMK